MPTTARGAARAGSQPGGGAPGRQHGLRPGGLPRGTLASRTALFTFRSERQRDAPLRQGRSRRPLRGPPGWPPRPCAGGRHWGPLAPLPHTRVPQNQGGLSDSPSAGALAARCSSGTVTCCRPFPGLLRTPGRCPAAAPRTHTVRSDAFCAN